MDASSNCFPALLVRHGLTDGPSCACAPPAAARAVWQSEASVQAAVQALTPQMTENKKRVRREERLDAGSSSNRSGACCTSFSTQCTHQHLKTHLTPRMRCAILLLPPCLQVHL